MAVRTFQETETGPDNQRLQLKTMLVTLATKSVNHRAAVFLELFELMKKKGMDGILQLCRKNGIFLNFGSVDAQTADFVIERDCKR